MVWKEEVEDAGEDRIADVAVMPRHRPGLDTAAEAIPHHQFVPVAKPLDEGFESGEIVGVIGIAHDDEFPLGGIDAGLERAAISTPGSVDDAGTLGSGEVLRAIGAAVVSDNDFAANSQLQAYARPFRHRCRLSTPRSSTA